MTELVLEHVDDFDSQLDRDSVANPKFLELIDRNYQRIVNYFQAQNRADTMIHYRGFMKERSFSQDARKSRGDWVFITLNPKEGIIDDIDFVNLCHSAFNCKLWDKGWYSFEQRGVDGDFKGWHCHALFHRNSSPSHITRELRRKFSHICITDKSIDVQYVMEDQVEKIKLYITGEKANKSKMPKVHNDHVWRKKLNLKDLYALGETTCYPPAQKIKLILKKPYL